MASLLQLPRELSLQVFSYLSLGDKAQMSATCKKYRLHLAPELFATISFTNEDDIAQSALAAVKAHGTLTTRIEFTPSATGEDKFVSPALVPAASELLRGRHTPNARAAQIHFAFDFDASLDWEETYIRSWGNNHSNSIWVFQPEETEAEIEPKEQQYRWRALMTETWAALAENVHVTDLTVRELVPKWTSAFRTAQFRDFLGRLESATLSIWGGDDGECKSSMIQGYVEWLSKDLGGAFFRHMTKLRHLAIHASKCGALGAEGDRYIPLPLEPGDFPVLESLALANCYVGPELVAFVGGHVHAAAVLRRLDVDGCVSRGLPDFEPSSPSCWAEFFDQIYALRSSALAELVVGRAHVPLGSMWAGDDEDKGESVPEAREIRRRLEEEPGRKLFGYCFQDVTEGTFWPVGEKNREAFWLGDDQRAYDRLMDLVERNAARAGAS
ncbi:hypothetical protein PG984_011956 [Apiospora sp. TS-2023a]